MTDQDTATKMPQHVAAISACGYAIWANEEVDPKLRAKFDGERIRVAGVRNVRVWGLQSMTNGSYLAASEPAFLTRKPGKSISKRTTSRIMNLNRHY